MTGVDATYAVLASLLDARWQAPAGAGSLGDTREAELARELARVAPTSECPELGPVARSLALLDGGEWSEAEALMAVALASVVAASVALPMMGDARKVAALRGLAHRGLAFGTEGKGEACFSTTA